MKLVFATRPSALARWQTRWVMNAVREAHPHIECEERVIHTQGDRVLDQPLPEIGGKGLFTAELEEALRRGRVQAAVHSLKDLPAENPNGLTIGAVPVRAEVRDALVSRHGFSLESLPANAVLGTSSLRRAAQVWAVRPDVQIRSIRGNIETRLRKLMEGQYDAVLFAAAGLMRLGLDAGLLGKMHLLPLDMMLPAPGQGALAVQCRANDEATMDVLACIHDEVTARAVAAERAFLAGLGGGCSVPVAAYGSQGEIEKAIIRLTGLVISLDGKHVVRVNGSGADPEALGRNLAAQALAQGAQEILAQALP